MLSCCVDFLGVGNMAQVPGRRQWLSGGLYKKDRCKYTDSLQQYGPLLPWNIFQENCNVLALTK